MAGNGGFRGMRKAVWWGVALLAILAAAFFALVPGIVERSMNRVEPTPVSRA